MKSVRFLPKDCANVPIYPNLDTVVVVTICFAVFVLALLLGFQMSEGRTQSGKHPARGDHKGEKVESGVYLRVIFQTILSMIPQILL